MPFASSSITPLQPDHRAAARFDTELEVEVQGMSAQARNISANGVYFESAVDLPIGSLLDLKLQFTQGGRKHWLACEGKVVRVTHESGRHCVAARLVTPFFSHGEERYVASAAKR